MAAPFDPVPHVIKERGERLADARGVVAVADPACAPGDQRRAHQALGIDDRIVMVRAQRLAEAADLGPSLGAVQAGAPAPRSDRDHRVDAGMQARERRIGLLDDPGEPRVGKMPPGIGDRRHVMDDVAERRGLDEQNFAHDRVRRSPNPL